ncbi:MAG: holo-ACP synthase [Deltaproteobacteria bacterium]|nr:holo-ACP synthase [Deltaproteobacteria bacterium]
MATGIDVVDIKRIEDASKSERFLKRIFTEEELNYSFNRKFPYRHLAGRFAAKEACVKALTTVSGFSWKDIEVIHGGSGSPALKLSSGAKRLLGERKIFLSIAYSRAQALAFVAIE